MQSARLLKRSISFTPPVGSNLQTFSYWAQNSSAETPVSIPFPGHIVQSTVAPVSPAGALSAAAPVSLEVVPPVPDALAAGLPSFADEPPAASTPGEPPAA